MTSNPPPGDGIAIFAPGHARLTVGEAIRLAGGHDPLCSKLIVAQAGEDGKPVFSMDAEVHARVIHYGDDEDACVKITGIMPHSPAQARVRAACYQLAADIADAANQLARATGKEG